MPFTVTHPSSGTRSPAIILSSVDFPEPFAPMIPTKDPAGMTRLTSRTASRTSTGTGRKADSTRSASVVWRSCGMRYVFETPRTSMAFI